MKSFLLIFILISAVSCKNDSIEKDHIEQDTPNILEAEAEAEDSLYSSNIFNELQDEKIKIKQEKLINQTDDREDLNFQVIDQHYFKDEDLFIIDFHYPLLNENNNQTFVNFNKYITDYYVNVTGTEAGILEDKELICDTLRINRFKEKRFINYKVYNINDRLLSILFYKENYYARTLNPTYSFDCVNFDMNHGVFMKYEDFFLFGSEEEIRGIINEIIRKSIIQGDLYFDCWEVSEEDFLKYKSNFVLNGTNIEFYFDDCVMCPSYTGSYSIEVPLTDLLSVLKRFGIDQEEYH